MPTVVLASLLACFAEPPATDDAGDTSTGSPTTSTTEASTTVVATTTETTATADASGTTETVQCEPVTIDDVAVGHRFVNLSMVVFTGTDVSAFDAIQPSLLDMLIGADSEDLRLVFADDGTVTLPVSPEHVCASCGEKTCTSAVHFDLVGPPHFGPLFAAAILDAFACVLHPPDDASIARQLVVLGSAPDIDPVDLEGLVQFIDQQTDARVDLLCNGCSPGGSSDLEMLIEAAGGFIHDLSDPEDVMRALFAAGFAPPACVWPITDEVAPPHDVSGLQVVVDFCGPEEPCPSQLERVGGPGACDTVPVTPQFYVVSDLFSPNVSGVVLCPHACAVSSNAIASSVSVQHVYACPE